MIKKEQVQKFIFKVDTEGLNYAVEHYAPEDAGDEKFDELSITLRGAIGDMEIYIQKLRDTYGIEYS